MLYFFHHYELPLVMQEENLRRIVNNLQNNPNVFEEPQRRTGPSPPSSTSQLIVNGGGPGTGTGTNQFYSVAPDTGGRRNDHDDDDDDASFEYVSSNPAISNRERRQLATRRAGERMADNIVSSVLEGVWTSMDSAQSGSVPSSEEVVDGINDQSTVSNDDNNAQEANRNENDSILSTESFSR